MWGKCLDLALELNGGKDSQWSHMIQIRKGDQIKIWFTSPARNNSYALQPVWLMLNHHRNLKWSVRTLDENVVQQKRGGGGGNPGSVVRALAITFRCFSLNSIFTAVSLSTHIFSPCGCWGQPPTWGACLEVLTCNYKTLKQEMKFSCEKTTLRGIFLSLWHAQVLTILSLWLVGQKL